MSDSSRGTDRIGRRAKRFLTPLQKYEIWLQLLRGETTISEAADQWEVDRSTIMRLREVAKQGALAALAESRPGTRSKEQDLELAQAKAEAARLGEATRGAGRQAAAGGGKRALGLSGRVPPRVDAATKAGLLDLLEQAVEAGFQFRTACRVLELGTVRAYRWLGRRAADELADRRPGGSPLHGLLDWEVAEIIGLFHQWGEVDRSHRKLAHRGSYLERVWVSPSSVRRVLAAEGLRLRPLPRPGRSVRKPFPDWWSTRPTRSGSSTPPTSPAPAWPRP
jgi:transposase-like protein